MLLGKKSIQMLNAMLFAIGMVSMVSGRANMPSGMNIDIPKLSAAMRGPSCCCGKNSTGVTGATGATGATGTTGMTGISGLHSYGFFFSQGAQSIATGAVPLDVDIVNQGFDFSSPTITLQTPGPYLAIFYVTLDNTSVTTGTSGTFEVLAGAQGYGLSSFTTSSATGTTEVVGMAIFGGSSGETVTLNYSGTTISTPNDAASNTITLILGLL